MTKSVPLSDDGISFREDAFFQMMARCFYPNSIDDVRLAVEIAKHEEKRFLLLGKERYEPSEIIRTLTLSIEKREGRRAVCGYVAIVMCFNQFFGRASSLYEASRVVSELCLSIRNFEMLSYSGKLPAIKTIPATSDIATIQNIFRENRSAAHICAARLSCWEFIEPRQIFERAPAAEKCIISTAAFFQSALEKESNASSWGLWDVRNTLPAEAADYPPLLLSEELLHAIYTPHMKRRTQGRN